MNTISAQFKSFFVDIKLFFIDLYNKIHDFLSHYFDDNTIGIFGIVLIAGILIFTFLKISQKND